MKRNASKSTLTSAATRRLAVAALASMLFLAVAGPAVAEDPISAQYNNSVSQVDNSSSSGEEASGLQETVISGLPFTGLDVIALAAVALALVSIGFALRRLSTQPQQD